MRISLLIIVLISMSASSFAANGFGPLIKLINSCNSKLYGRRAEQQSAHLDKMKSAVDKVNSDGISVSARKDALWEIKRAQSLWGNFYAADELRALSLSPGKVSSLGTDFKYIYENALHQIIDQSSKVYIDGINPGLFSRLSKSKLSIETEISYSTFKKAFRGEWNYNVQNKLNEMTGTRDLLGQYKTIDIVNKDAADEVIKLAKRSLDTKVDAKYARSFANNIKRLEVSNIDQEELLEILSEVSAYIQYKQRFREDISIRDFKELAGPMYILLSRNVSRSEPLVERATREFAADILGSLTNEFSKQDELVEKIRIWSNEGLDPKKEKTPEVIQAEATIVFNQLNKELDDLKSFVSVFTNRVDKAKSKVDELILKGKYSTGERYTDKVAKKLKLASRLLKSEHPELRNQGHEIYNTFIKLDFYDLNRVVDEAVD